MTPYFKEQLGCEGSMSQHDTLTLRDALRNIQYEAASLADAQVIALQALNATYPARAALSATQPAQAKQPEPAEHWHRLYLEKCQQYNDRVAQLGGVIEGLEAQAVQGASALVLYRREIGEGDWAPCTPEQYAEACDNPHWDTKTDSVGQPAVAQGASEVFTALADHCPVDNGWFNGRAAQGEPVRHIGDSKFESWYQAHPKANGGDKQLARDAYAAGMFDPVAQGAGEVVAGIIAEWRDVILNARHNMDGVLDNDQINEVLNVWDDMAIEVERTLGTAVPSNAQAQLRAVEKLIDGSQPIDIPGALAVIRHGGTTPPPAQAAADARDAERYRWLRDQANTSVNIDIGAGCEISDTLDAAIDAVLATHQQRQDGDAPGPVAPACGGKPRGTRNATDD